MEDPSANIRNAVYSGLGIAYAGARKEELVELLLPVVENEESSITECSLAALSLGISFVGSCNSDIAEVRISDSFVEPYLNYTLAISLCHGYHICCRVVQ